MVPGAVNDYTPQDEPPPAKPTHISGPAPADERSIGFPPLT